MEYFAVNEEIEQKIKHIRRDIMLSMNGICTENMRNSGFTYRQNFGVALSRLREIANKHTPNYDLSYRLWLLPIRECKILATMLCPPDIMDSTKLHQWLKNLDNQELAEVISMYLFSKAPHLRDEFITLLKSDNFFYRLTAIHTISRIVMTLDITTLVSAIDNVQGCDMDNISATRAIESLIFQANEQQSATIDSSITNLITRIKSCGGRYASQIQTIG